MKKRILALALISVCLLSACNAGGSPKSASYGERDMMMTAAATTSAAFSANQNYATDEAAKESEMMNYALGSGASAEPAGAPPTAGMTGEVANTALAAQEIGRKLIRTGYYSLETLDYPKTIQQIEELVNSVGGYIQSSSTSGEGSAVQTYVNPRWAYYTVRIPADSFFSFGGSLGGIATVISSNQSAEEVTDYYYDTEARLKTLRVQEERLLTLMSQATELEAVILLESNLSQVRYQIESHEGTLRRLDSQVSFSTLSIEVHEVFTPTKLEPVPITLGERIAARFKNTLEHMKNGAENALVVLLGDAPQILLNLAIFAAIVWIFVAVYKKIRARRALKPEKSPQNEQSGETQDKQ